MRTSRLSLFLTVPFALVLGGCASAAPDPAPTPEPANQSASQPATQPAAVDTAAPAAAAEPLAPVAGAPERWWLADADAVAPGAGVERAYRELLAGREPRRTVVIGVIDSGIDIAHEDLRENIWVNVDEVPGNGVDDDDNGYIDDIHGWNFIGGPDGRHVDRDTYEVARLHADCRAPGGGPYGGPPHGPGVDASCAEIEAELEEGRREAEQQLAEIQYMESAVTQIVGILRREASTDSLTPEVVESLTPMRLDVRQAQAAYLQLVEAGITPDMVTEERRRLERRLEYGLNPDFDPRPIVGDDFGDVDERGYGNADVTGPRAFHGTGVAGIIAAERDNGIGEDGIAPSARIMVLRAVPDGDERDKDVANAIRYAADNGADIINMSFGKAHSPRKAAVDAAVRYAEERGVLLIHAAGNAAEDLDEDPSYPTRRYSTGGQADSWIEVGASDWRGPDQLAAAFSNFSATQVDIFAPGVDIHTTTVDDAYQTISGTSFAAPVVSGVAALIMAYYPELDAAQVRRLILESASPHAAAIVALPSGQPDAPGAGASTVPFGNLSVTGGIVDAHAALLLAEEWAGTID